MTYQYSCDGFCDGVPKDERPALTGEFNEQWFNTKRIGGDLKEFGFEPGDLITLCPDCTRKLLLEHGR